MCYSAFAALILKLKVLKLYCRSMSICTVHDLYFLEKHPTPFYLDFILLCDFEYQNMNQRFSTWDMRAWGTQTIPGGMWRSPRVRPRGIRKDPLRHQGSQFFLEV